MYGSLSDEPLFGRTAEVFEIVVLVVPLMKILVLK
jgi:hypothetical protein